MKKLFLLFLGTAIGSVGFAQGVTKSNKLVKVASARVAASDNTTPSTGTVNLSSNKKTRQTLQSFQSTFGTKEIVGRTTYDLQTNGSTQRRVQQSGNTISCAWTFSLEAALDETAAFLDRGTGYAHYDGTTWSAPPTARLENIRNGFGGFAGNGGSSETYISHDGTNFQFIMSKKTGSTWAQSTLTTSTTQQALWPHSAQVGNWLYIVSSSNDSNIHSNGIRNGVFFSRSNDGGNTWLDNQIPMPLIDSVNMYRAGGNSYAISANGSNVAVVFGDVGTDLVLVSSTDNGATWTKKVIFNWPLNNYNFAGTDPTDYNFDTVADTLWTTDGSQSITLDATGKAHVAFPLVRVIKPGGSTGYSFFYTSYIAYWNTDMGITADSVELVDGIFDLWHDCDGDSVFGIGVNYTGDNATDPDAIYNTIGTLTMPSITTTTGNPQKIMIAYTAIMDNDTTTDDPGPNDWSGPSAFFGQNYRDVMVIGTDNNGATWTVPVNISRTGHFEEAYPSVAESISGNKLAVLYQADREPGTLMQNDDAPDSYFQNLMVCQVVNIDSIFNQLGKDSSAPCYQFQLPLGTNSITSAEGSFQVYPNPANDLIHVNMNLTKTSNNVSYQLTDMMGRVLYQDQVKNVMSLNKVISLSGLASGHYILTVKTDAGIHTEKVIKE